MAFVKRIGSGRLVVIGSDYNLYTEASARLLANACLRPSEEVRHKFLRGDANSDGRVNLADAIMITAYLFAGRREPECLDAADTNDSASPGNRHSIDIADAVYLLQFLFAGGPPPPPPFRSIEVHTLSDCGWDPQWDDGLDCKRYQPCE